MPKLVLDTSDPSKGKVILADGKELEAKIELLPKDTKGDEDEEIWWQSNHLKYDTVICFHSTRFA